MNLSPNFTLAELLRSEAAARRGRVIETPEPWIVDNLVRLCDTVLEPLRARIGRPIVTLSGYRPPWLNDLVGGSKTSDHMTGCAADILVPGLTPFVVARRIEMAELPFKQCILEFGQWVHVSVPKAGDPPKRELLTARHVNGRTVYTFGLTE